MNFSSECIFGVANKTIYVQSCRNSNSNILGRILSRNRGGISRKKCRGQQCGRKKVVDATKSINQVALHNGDARMKF